MNDFNLVVTLSSTCKSQLYSALVLCYDFLRSEGRLDDAQLLDFALLSKFDNHFRTKIIDCK